MIKLFKRLRLFGALRFRILLLGHHYLLPCGGYSSQQKWVLDYLPYVYDRNKLKILDVGSTGSLLIYELYRLGYETWGIDFRPYQEKLPRGIKFVKDNLLDLTLPPDYFDYITNIGVLNHVGAGQYGEKKYSDGERLMFDVMATVLKPNGIALLVTTSERIVDKYARKGYNYLKIKNMVAGLFEIQEYTERHGHICVALIKI
jgi:2-polyprenyl-3-methyl-5-hydroxy-6-metoxy-1,4-benzoquinol methylase